MREFLLLHPNTSSNRAFTAAASNGGAFEEAQFFGVAANYARGARWYRELFNETRDGALVVLEKTANYFDSATAPIAMSQLLPAAKIAIVLIDPATRAYSWYQVSSGGARAFHLIFICAAQFQHARAHNDPIALRYSAAEVLVAADAAANTSDAAALEKLRRRCLSPGRYAQHLERWLDVYAPAQLLLVDGDALRNRPIGVMNRLRAQLGLPPTIDYARLLAFDARKGFFCKSDGAARRCLGTSKGRVYAPMSDELRRRVNAIYEAPNRALRRLLNRYALPLPSFLLHTG